MYNGVGFVEISNILAIQGDVWSGSIYLVTSEDSEFGLADSI